MGFFGKIFKSIGKVFTSIGKVIKKAFTAVGKFTNKLGIVGQIGMMFIMPAIGGLAMKGLTTLGSGFMTGLSTAAQGTGALSGVAKVTHGIFSTVANVASAGIRVYKSITGAVSNVFKGITNGLKGALGIPVDADISETLNSASNALSGRPVYADPYAIAGEVATPDPYDTLRRGISLDDVFDSSKGLIGAKTTPVETDTLFSTQPGDTKNWTQGIFDNSLDTDVRYGTKLPPAKPLSAAEQARAAFNASAAAGSEIAQVPIATTEPLVTAVVPSEPGIVQKALTTATQNLVTSGVRSLFAPSYVEPPVELDYAQHVPGKTSLYARSLAENLARGSGAPLGTLSSSVIGGDWNSTFNSNPVYAEEINRGGYLAQMDNAYTDWLKTGVIPSQPSNLVV